MQTPYYIFNRKKFIDLLLQYKKTADVYYPIKANDNRYVIEAVIENDASFEVDSIQHIKKLIGFYNVNANKIIYSFPIKKKSDLLLAKSLGVVKYVVDSYEEYYKIKETIKKPQFIIRLSANALVSGLDVFQDKWGFSPSQIPSVIKKIIQDGGELYGISFYLSSEINSYENFIKVLDYLKTIDLSLFHMVDIGGGINIETLNRLSNKVNDIKALTHGRQIIVEPGKDLLDPCFEMRVSIMAIKESFDGKNKIFIDAGIYNGLLDVIIKDKQFEIVDTKGDQHASYYICGCSSDVSDYIGLYSLSSTLQVGDELIIKGCGAYSAVMATNFYSMPKSKVKVKA